MQEDGVVSVWIGTADSRATWDWVIDTSSSEDGRSLGSEFCRGFDIAHCDDDYREAQFHQRGRSNLEMLLRGVSYDDQVIPAVERLEHGVTDADNCFILLYNYRHVGRKTEWDGHGVRLRFVGTVNYDPAK